MPNRVNVPDGLEVTGPKARPTLLTVELDADSPLEVPVLGGAWLVVIGIGSLVDSLISLSKLRPRPSSFLRCAGGLFYDLIFVFYYLYFFILNTGFWAGAIDMGAAIKEIFFFVK